MSFYFRILLVLEIINLMESCFCSCLEFVPCFKYYLLTESEVITGKSQIKALIDVLTK